MDTRRDGGLSERIKEELYLVQGARCELGLREPDLGKRVAKRWQLLTNDRVLAETVEALCRGGHEHGHALHVMRDGTKRSVHTETYPDPLLVRLVLGALAALDAQWAAEVMTAAAEETDVAKLTEN